MTRLMGLLDQPPTQPPEIDERFVQVWIGYGLDELDHYLANHAAFAAYLAQREKEEPDDHSPTA